MDKAVVRPERPAGEQLSAEAKILAQPKGGFGKARRSSNVLEDFISRDATSHRGRGHHGCLQCIYCVTAQELGKEPSKRARMIDEVQANNSSIDSTEHARLQLCAFESPHVFLCGDGVLF